MSDLLHGLQFNKGKGICPIKDVSVVVVNAGHGDATLIKVTDTSGQCLIALFVNYIKC